MPVSRTLRLASVAGCCLIQVPVRAAPSMGSAALAHDSGCPAHRDRATECKRQAACRSRPLCDGLFVVADLSDLAVSSNAQGPGAGQGMTRQTRRLPGSEAALILVSVPQAAGFCQRIGMERIHNTFWLRRER